MARYLLEFSSPLGRADNFEFFKASKEDPKVVTLANDIPVPRGLKALDQAAVDNLELMDKLYDERVAAGRKPIPVNGANFVSDGKQTPGSRRTLYTLNEEGFAVTPEDLEDLAKLAKADQARVARSMMNADERMAALKLEMAATQKEQEERDAIRKERGEAPVPKTDAEKRIDAARASEEDAKRVALAEEKRASDEAPLG